MWFVESVRLHGEMSGRWAQVLEVIDVPEMLPIWRSFHHLVQDAEHMRERKDVLPMERFTNVCEESVDKVMGMTHDQEAEFDTL